LIKNENSNKFKLNETLDSAKENSNSTFETTDQVYISFYAFGKSTY
jgi:hypothetical protein